MRDDCLFCKILNGDVPSDKVYEDEQVYGFVDIHPQAKTHWLFIHKKHTQDIQEMVDTPQQFSEIYRAITHAAKENDLDQKGYRVVTNLGKNAGQTVFHTHFHVVGGESLGTFGS